MLRMKFRISHISIALVITLVLSGLWSDNACAQKELTRIKIAYAAPTVDNVLIAVADKEGLFEKFGLKAELIGMRGGVQVAAGTGWRRTDFGQGGGPESVQAIASGDGHGHHRRVDSPDPLSTRHPARNSHTGGSHWKENGRGISHGNGNDCDAPGPGSSRSASKPHYFFSCGSSSGPGFGSRFWKYGCHDCSTREYSCGEESGAKDPKRSVGNP